MTDLPQLERALVEAAARRYGPRRPRLRSAGRRVLLVAVPAAAAVLALLAVLTVDGREATAPPPPGRAVPATVEEAYGVFRRPARPADRIVRLLRPSGRPGPARLVARLGDQRYFLVQVEDQLCLSAPRSSEGCGPAETSLDGRRPLGTFSDEPGPARFVFVFVDGIRTVRATLEDGSVRALRVRDNAVAAEIPSRLVRLEWRTPDGVARERAFRAAPPRPKRASRADGRRIEAAFGVLRGGKGEAVVFESGALVVRIVRSGQDVCLVRQKVGQVCRPYQEAARAATVLAAADPAFFAVVLPEGIGRVELLDAAGTVVGRRTVRRNVVTVAGRPEVRAMRFTASDGALTTVARRAAPRPG